MRTFQAMFNIASGARTISFENGESTTIPVVLELDVKPAENQAANVASDPAVETPEANPSTDEKAKTEGQNYDVTGVEGTEEDPALPEVSVEDEVAMAEAEAEKNELINEAEIVDDTIEKIEEDTATIKETLDANDAVVAAGGEDQINAANVAIATQALELRLERLGLNLKDLSSSANISRETFLSKEQGGMGLKPSDVLRNLHNDICREDGVLAKIKAGGMAVWNAIINSINKIIEFVTNLFSNQESILTKLAGKLKTLDQTESVYNVGKNAPAYIEVMGRNMDKISESILSSIKEAVALNNSFIKLANKNQGQQAEIDDQINAVINGLHSMNINGDDVKPLAILRKKIKGFVKGKNGWEQYNAEIQEKDTDITFRTKEIETWVSNALNATRISKQYKETFKTMTKNFEGMINAGNKFQTFLANRTIKSFYSSLVNDAMKSVPEFNNFTIGLAKNHINYKPASDDGKK
jgi:hypothetical protein